MNPDERVGGMVFATQSAGGVHFECVNGPILNWDDPANAPRQIATFAIAVSKLHRSFQSLILRPRWRQGSTEQRLSHLPVAHSNLSYAATVQVPILATEHEQLKLLSPRMRRTLAKTRRESLSVEWNRPTQELLEAFLPRMADFAESKGFTVPPLEWFLSLIRQTTESPEPCDFRLGTARLGDELLTQHLVCRTGGKTYYLFGHEQRRDSVSRAISGAATLHLTALDECRYTGTRVYDLNGYIKDVEPDHPYAGVCRFKEQLGGTTVAYEVPEFVIS